jgi:hypothetical protein
MKFAPILRQTSLMFLVVLAVVLGYVGLARAGETTPAVTAPEPGTWLVRPEQTGARILRWAEQFPDLVSLDTLQTLGGRTAYAVTITKPQSGGGQKRRLIFAQPHAHEPATTAGMMEFLCRLLEGKRLDGRPGGLDREQILAGAVLTFIPDGNPDGRAKAQQAWWDGRRYSNDAFLDFAFGRTEAGGRFPRQGRWSTRKQQPALLGFVYEQISEHEYVEPNRDRASTYFKLLLRSLQRGPCDLVVDLHQTEFTGSQYNAMIILPFMQNDLPEAIQAANRRAARAIIDAWREMGARAVPEAKPLGYGEEQLRYFRQCYGDIFPSVPFVTVEVQNNNPQTPPAEQRQLIEVSIGAAIQSVLGGGSRD